MNNISNNSVRKQDYILANSYKIEEFSPEDFNDITGGIVAIIAETGAGKTVLLKDIISKIHKRYKKIHLMSRTAKLQSAYDFVPRSMITDDYDEEKMISIWDQQIKAKDEGRPIENILVILDDVIASKSFTKSKMLDEIAISGRHLNITVIILSQYFISLKPRIRENIRIAIAFSMANKKEREKFINQFLSADTFGAGELLFKNITGTKYQTIIIQKYKTGEPINNRVKKYIADPNVVIELKEPEEERVIIDDSLVRPRTLKKKQMIRTSKWGI